MRKCLWAWLVAAWFAAAAWAVDWKSLRQQGCVSDFAGVIDSGSKSQLENYCAAVDRATGFQIVLVTLPSLEGEPVDDVAQTIFAAWRDPAKAPDRRFMLLLAIRNRMHWVTAGGGLPPGPLRSLPSRVLREIRPALRRRDYNEVFRAAAQTAGEAAAQSANARIDARLPRRWRWTLVEAISWPAVGGAVLILAWLFCAGAPRGYGGFAGRGLLPSLLRRRSMRRSTWGSRGSGGFGGYDSGDTVGGFGGAPCNDW